MSHTIIVDIKIGENGILPERATEHSSGYDLRASEEHVLKPGERVLVGTDLKVAIPEGYELQIRSRSGLALKNGIMVLNGIGTIDSDYRGFVGVILMNLGTKTFIIHKGDRIAQGVFAKVEKVEFFITDDLAESDRGDGGFGSTGKK